MIVRFLERGEFERARALCPGCLRRGMCGVNAAGAEKFLEAAREVLDIELAASQDGWPLRQEYKVTGCSDCVSGEGSDVGQR